MSDESNFDVSSLGPSDSVTETEHKSFFSRLMGSLVSILIGLVLIPAACVGLFWNEGRAVQTARALSEGAALAITVPAAKADPANEGKLVHVTGKLIGADLSDAELGVSVRAVRLVRDVEMFQWKENSRTETRKNLGGSEERITTYSYEQVWSDQAIDSSRFRQRDGHQNPQFAFQSRTIEAPQPMLGAFSAKSVVSHLGGSGNTDFRIPDSALPSLKQRLGNRAQLVDGRAYVSDDPSAPRIGNLRISYKILPEGDVSAAARQQNGELVNYRTSNGRDIFLAEIGVRSSAELFKDAQDENRIWTWVIRVAGLFGLFFGFLLLFSPFTVLASVIPFLGSIFEAGAAFAALVGTLSIGIPTIAIAWLVARPLLGGALIALMVAAVFGLRYLAEKRRAARGPVMPAPVPGYGAPPGYAPAAGYAPQSGFAPPPPAGYAPPAAPGYPPAAAPSAGPGFLSTLPSVTDNPPPPAANGLAPKRRL